jgi:hypothetical protein
MKRYRLLLLLWIFTIQNNFALGARVRAMGGAFIGLADDENAIFNNVAGLSQLDGSRYHIDFLMNGRNEYTNDSFAYASQIYERTPMKRFSIEEYLENEFQFSKVAKRESRYNFAIAYNRDTKSRDFVQKIMNDEDSSSQLGQSVAAPIETNTLTLGFATKFPMAQSLFQKNEVYGGLTLKYIQSKRELASLNQSSSKDVLNVGVSTLVRTPGNFSFGAVLDAIISEKISADSNTQGSSANLSIGAAYRIDKASNVAIDFTNVLDAERATSPQVKVGFERELIEDELALRLGSWDGTFTMGFGLKLFENMKIDYGYFNGDVLKEHYISTSLPF